MKYDKNYIQNFCTDVRSYVICICIAQILLLIVQSHGTVSQVVTYHISLFAGFMGMVLFAVLLYFVLVKRLNKISNAVKQVAQGNLSVQLNMKGNDELCQLSNHFNTMTKTLKANEYLSTEFVKNVSHEFKTPVSIIVGYANLLQQQSLTDEQRQQYATVICQQSSRLNQLSTMLLRISRLDSGTVKPEMQTFCLDEQIRLAVLSMQNLWQNKNLTMDIQLQPTNINCSRDLCDIVWHNLISNAVKYAPAGSIVSISLQQNEHQTMFSITNDGTLDEKQRQLVFQPFFTTDSSSGEKGTGLGLPLAKKIVQTLGGDLQLNVDEKITFVVTLPNSPTK